MIKNFEIENWDIDKIPVKIGTAAIAICHMAHKSQVNLKTNNAINLVTRNDKKRALENKNLLLDLARYFKLKNIEITIKSNIDSDLLTNVNKKYDTFKIFNGITIIDDSRFLDVGFLNYVGEKGSLSSKLAHTAARCISLQTGSKVILFNSTKVFRFNNLIYIYDPKYRKKNVSFRQLVGLIGKSKFFLGEANGIGVLGILLSNYCVVFKPLNFHPFKMLFELKFSSVVPIKFKSNKSPKIIRKKVNWRDYDQLISIIRNQDV